jgi:deoxycytidylate deaminase
MADNAAMVSPDLEISPDPPPQTELVIGLVGAVGIDLKGLADELGFVLSRFAYRPHDVHLSEQLPALDWKYELHETPYDERIASYMSAGNTLRKKWKRDDAFGLLAINEITRIRKEQSGDIRLPVDRHAYIIRSLKRKEEAELLRAVYGSRFVQLSIYAPQAARRRYLKKRIRESRVASDTSDLRPVHTAKQLILRDQSEAVAHGQEVQGIFHRGDFFIDATGDKQAQLARTVEVLFGHPNRTPTRDEFGMFQAEAAARRSAELGRQVGAAICTHEGAVIAVGTNEVPRAGGGLYWEGDPDDAREFTLGRDMSNKRKSRIARQIAADLSKSGWMKKGISRRRVRQRVERTDLGQLIEFVRAVHAEMAALMDAARRGISVADSTLYVTTFPCHHCARHIVAAGIKRVVYVAPYAKSLAGGLHNDSILVDPPHTRLARRRVTFEPFVGIGPTRYLDLFGMRDRKDDAGKVLKFRPKKARPRLTDVEPEDLRPDLLPYISRERRALELLGSVQEKRGPRLSGFTD